jgi:hypothetical protein
MDTRGRLACGTWFLSGCAVRWVSGWVVSQGDHFFAGEGLSEVVAVALVGDEVGVVQ